jgi:hypothetical protein
MSDVYRGVVATKPGTYADGDQKLTLRLVDGGSSFVKGESVTVARATVPQPEPQPVPEPTPEPTPTPAPVPVPVPEGDRLLGGWVFPFDYQRGAIAMDFSRNKLWMVGHAQRNEVLEYDLPPMGTGTSWPLVFPTRVIPRFWTTTNAHAYGLAFFRSKLWASPRVFYQQDDPATPQSEIIEPLTIYAEDGETITFPATMPRQIFSGFVKRGPGVDPFIGGGGYESGQGTASGPSLATLDGQVLLEYGWPGTPGANLEHWNERAPREPNYSVLRDDWIGWQPRTVNGELQGRWASDRIYGGGLALPDGIYYWPWMACQGNAYPLDYAYQTYTFAYDPDNRTYEYRYTPEGQFASYRQLPDLGVITGQELGPDGRIYLLDMGLGWLTGPGTCVLKVFA